MTTDQQPEEPTLRERKKRKTRDALTHAALTLFRQRGFERTTVDEIAEAAQVSRRTFFRYFPSKEAVAFFWNDAHLDHFRQLLDDIEPDETRFQTVRRACLALARHYVADRQRLVMLHRIIASSPALLAYQRQYVDEPWRNAITKALLEPRANATGARRARVVSAAVFGVVQVTLEDWYAAGGRGDLVRMGRESFELLERGVAAP